MGKENKLVELSRLSNPLVTHSGTTNTISGPNMMFVQLCRRCLIDVQYVAIVVAYNHVKICGKIKID